MDDTNKIDLSKATVIDGIAATENWDAQGEKLVLSGCDISECKTKGYFNAEHQKGFHNLLGKITDAKKIMSERDIDDERQRFFWKKNGEKPYLYAKGILFDDPGSEHVQAKAVSAIMNQFAKMNVPLAIQMSVEGRVVDRDNSGVIKQSMVRNIALTVTPANDSTTTDVVSHDVANQIITKCQEIGADVNYASDLIKNLNSGIRPIQNRFIELPDSEIEKLKSVRSKVEQATSMIKMLSVGYGGAGAPTSRVNGAAMAEESVDKDLKSATIPEDKKEESEKDKKKKAKKELFKALIDKVQKNHPNLPYDKVVEYSMEIFRSKKQ